MEKTGIQKIDKFYLALILTLILMSGLVIFTFRGVFSAYLTAYELSESDLQSDLNVRTKELDEAYDWALQKQTIPLEVR
jgi:hypothetical protein